MEQLPKELSSGSPLIGRLLTPLKSAYLAQIAHHDPEIGCDGYTFGTGIWRSTWFFLEQEFREIARRPGNAFYLEFHEYNLYVYRDRVRGTNHRVIGRSAVQKAILDLNSQICFDFVPLSTKDGRPNLVALHTGISPVGLTELCIGLPISYEDPDTAWRFIENVYSYSASQPLMDATSPLDVRPFNEMQAPDIDIHPEENVYDAADGNAT